MLTEISFTRLASAALFYHYAFLAVAVAMAGLCLGSLMAALTPAPDEPTLRRRLAAAATWGTAGLLLWVALIALLSPRYDSLVDPVIFALGALPAMTAMGDLVARLLIHAGADRPRVYAVDLACSAIGALLAVPLLQRLEGPGILFAPMLLLAVVAWLAAGRGRGRAQAAVLVVLCAAGVAAEAARPGPLVVPRPAEDEPFAVIWERWNHHSRIRVATGRSGTTPELIIDRSASSFIPPVPQGADLSTVDPASYIAQGSSLAYHLGDRPLARVGVIGVGGGPDVIEAVRAGAERVDGFELNGRILELLGGAGGFTHLGRTPGVRLHHDEARHALAHGEARYDVLRMTLTDTWAATAQGGFVLSEAALYTLEAWRMFLDRLTPDGRLAVTRWLLPAAPAEAERTVALAAAALRERGLDPARHLVAIEQPYRRDVHLITVIVTPTALTEAEVARLERAVADERCRLLLAPGRAPWPAAAAWPAHYTADGHARRAAASDDDISVPTDRRPFFFLQKRPFDVALLEGAEDPVSAIVRSGVRGMIAGFALSVLLAATILVANVRALRRRDERAGLPGLATAAGLGLGYMLLQLGLHQRLSIVVGHPTATLAFVVAAFILGSGVGSLVLGDARRGAWSRRTAVLLAVALALAIVWKAEWLDRLPAGAAAAAAALLVGAVGAGVGGQMPALLRRVEGAGESVGAVWTANGAASVAGAGLAALVALWGGSLAVVALGGACYVLVALRD